MQKKFSVSINGRSYDANFAAQLGKAEWSKEVAKDFKNEAEAGEAFDSMMKQRDDAEKEAMIATADEANAGKVQAEAQKKLDARSAVKGATPSVTKAGTDTLKEGTEKSGSTGGPKGI